MNSENSSKGSAVLNVPNILSLVRVLLVPAFVATLLFMKNIEVWGIIVPTILYILTALTDKIKLLGAANRVLGAVWGALMAAIILLMVASVIKLFFGETDFYQQTVVVKFFGDSALLEAIKIFNIGSAWFSQAPQA